MFLIKKNWFDLLKSEFETTRYKELESWLNHEYQNKIIYPKPENVFNALNLVKYNDVKVVIIGQDPYHNPNQAHGLSFSVENDVAIPPSLKNIYKELHDDMGCYIPNNGNLTKWAKQGVLLLNSVLTVEKNKPNSHKNKGWEQITGKVVELLNQRVDPVIFLLWGSNAKAIGKNIDRNKHYVLEAVHPSPMSANQGGWFGCHHFSKTNEILRKLNKTPIDWQIENI
ncbi:MAG TPA: uracil-DNA glycosylase [Clostridiales bacterium]|nr:uracil-DNA glycosylase [Clostridiales bacterium]